MLLFIAALLKQGQPTTPQAVGSIPPADRRNVIREQEERVVHYHSPHAVMGLSSKAHSHWEVWRETWEVSQVITKGPQGQDIVVEEREVPGSRRRSMVASGRERGHDMRPYIKVLK